MAISLRLGWRKDHLHPVGSGDPSATPNSVILPHRSPDSGCFSLVHTHTTVYHIKHSAHTPLYIISCMVHTHTTVHRIMHSAHTTVYHIKHGAHTYHCISYQAWCTHTHTHTTVYHIKHGAHTPLYIIPSMVHTHTYHCISYQAWCTYTTVHHTKHGAHTHTHTTVYHTKHGAHTHIPLYIIPSMVHTHHCISYA